MMATVDCRRLALRAWGPSPVLSVPDWLAPGGDDSYAHDRVGKDGCPG